MDSQWFPQFIRIYKCGMLVHIPSSRIQKYNLLCFFSWIHCYSNCTNSTISFIINNSNSYLSLSLPKFYPDNDQNWITRIMYKAKKHHRKMVRLEQINKRYMAQINQRLTMMIIWSNHIVLVAVCVNTDCLKDKYT